MTSGWHSYRTKKSLLQILFSPGSGWDYRQRYKWNVTLSWSKAPNQYNYFKNTSRGYINGSVIKISKKSDITNVAKKKGVQKGDLLYFVKPGKTAPHHAAIIVKVANGKIYYAAHTQSRKCQDLSKSIGKESVLIIRIKS